MLLGSISIEIQNLRAYVLCLFWRKTKNSEPALIIFGEKNQICVSLCFENQLNYFIFVGWVRKGNLKYVEISSYCHISLALPV